jgi:phosphohistidine phosphatase
MNHMAKTLFIVRHGEAKQKEPGEKDQDRMLVAEGLRQSSHLGAYLYKKNADISAIICSAARRAQQTAEQICDQLNFDLSKITYHGDLYEASVRILLDKVADFNNDWSEVIIVGHNPVVSYFVEYLTGHHFDGMEAGSVVKIACNVDNWLEISQDSSSFEYYATPRDY